MRKPVASHQCANLWVPCHPHATMCVLGLPPTSHHPTSHIPHHPHATVCVRGLPPALPTRPPTQPATHPTSTSHNPIPPMPSTCYRVRLAAHAEPPADRRVRMACNLNQRRTACQQAAACASMYAAPVRSKQLGRPAYSVAWCMRRLLLLCYGDFTTWLGSAIAVLVPQGAAPAIPPCHACHMRGLHSPS